MEQYFTPGFKTRPAVHVGSQTHPFFHGNSEEQAWEGALLAATTGHDIGVGRNIHPAYVDYWNKLMGKTTIINLQNTNPGEFLTEAILKDPKVIEQIKNNMQTNAKLMVFLPTELEQKLADTLNIPLHGSVRISNIYGTKSGGRILAKELGISTTPGFICTSMKDVQKAITALKKTFQTIVIKHDTSLSGYLSKKINTKKIPDLRTLLNKIAGGRFTEGKDVVVVEGWVKSKAALCAHIEIPQEKAPILCGGWQQVMDTDGITYVGAGPLMLSKKAMKSFLEHIQKIAQALKAKGAVGSFAPDFLVTEDDDCVFLELNARVPYTAFPLEVIKQVKGKIGAGFLSRHIKIAKKTTYQEIEKILREKKLLITKKGDRVKGIVPYNIGLLPWGIFDVVAIAPSFDEAKAIMQKVSNIFENP